MPLSQGIFKKKRLNASLKNLKHTGLSYLFQDISTMTSVAIATFIAVIYTSYLFPPSFLRGIGGFFEQVELLTGISGWQSFRMDSWHFPLLHTRLLNVPEGTNIAFTNSIPIAALVLKPIQQWLPQSFHYWGGWAVLSYLAQATTSVLLIRELGAKTMLAAIAASTMGLMMPILLYQTANIALITQAYLLLGLMFYFRGLRSTQSYPSVAHSFTFLLVAALLTHPYLFVMTGVFYLAFLGDFVKKFPHYQQNVLTTLGTTALCIIALLIIGGYLNQNIWTNGYGQYSMNLLAPISGGKLGYAVVNATLGQQRGYNYLGMGVLLSLCITLVMHRQSIVPSIQRHQTLVGILVLISIFAVSNHIFYGRHVLVQYPIFFPFTMIARLLPSSGRLFWPCSYTLMIIGLIGILHLSHKILSVTCVMLTLAIQFYDTAPLRKTLYYAARQPSSISNDWHRLARSVSAIQLYPAEGCGSTKAETIAFWQSLAARQGKPLNTAHIHRNKVSCPTKHAPFNRPMNKNQLYVVAPNQSNLPHHIASAMDNGWCRKTDQGVICIKNTDYSWWKNYFPNTTSKKPIVTSHKKPRASWPQKKKRYVDWPEGVD